MKTKQTRTDILSSILLPPSNIPVSMVTLATSAFLLTAFHADAALIVVDGFTDGSSLNNPGSAETGQQDIPWIRNLDTGTNTSTTTVTGFGSGNVMNFPTGGGSNTYVGTLYSVVGTGTVVAPQYVSRSSAPSITLGNNVDDGIRLTMDFRTAGWNGSLNARFFDVGLFNSNGTPLINNGVVGGTDDSGYWLRIPGDGNTGTSNLALRKVAGFGIFGTHTTLNSDTAVGNTISASTNYELRLDLRRATVGSTGNVELSYYLDGALILQTTDTSVSPFSTFDEISLAKRNNNQAFNIDNVVLQTVVIPEPSAALLGAFGALALLRRRR